MALKAIENNRRDARYVVKINARHCLGVIYNGVLISTNVNTLQPIPYTTL